MGAQAKIKTVPFALSDEEKALLLERVALHGFDNRNRYLVALIELEMALGLETEYDKPNKKLFFVTSGITKNGAASGRGKLQK